MGKSFNDDIFKNSLSTIGTTLSKEAQEEYKQRKANEVQGNTQDEDDKDIYVKKTIIVKQKQFKRIQGIALLKEMTQTEVINAIIDKGLEMLEENNKGILNKALKEIEKGKKRKELF